MTGRTLAAVVALVLAGCSWQSGDMDEISAVSPDGRNKIRLYLRPMSYEVVRDGKVVVAKSRMSLHVDGKRMSREVEETEPVVSSGRVMGKFFPSAYKKSKVFDSAYETKVDFGSWGVRLVARDDGVAYRFETRYPEAIRVNGERADFTIPDSQATCWVGFTSRFGCGAEKHHALQANDVKTGFEGRRLISAPFVYRVGDTTVAVVETDVHDYPMRNFDETESPFGAVAFKSVFARWPKRTYRDADGKRVDAGGRRVVVEKHSEWLVETAGTRTFPWRAFALADRSIQLLENDISYALARPSSADDDFAWVKHGRIAGECLSAACMRCVDLAAANGVGYVALDDGWMEGLDIWKFSERANVPRAIEHANAHGVGIILSMPWSQVVGDEERVASHFAEIGVKGFRIGCIDRGDAEAVRFMWRFAEACRRNRMVVDFLGAHRSTGISRAYPNVLRHDGLRGLEQIKKGTLSRKMAISALCDAPFRITDSEKKKSGRGKSEILSFMASVPTVWDETMGMDGAPDAYAVVARRRGDAWYVMGVTNASGRYYTLDTSFLPDGEWNMEVFRDMYDSDENEESYFHTRLGLKRGESIVVRMVSGGGFIARFTK